MDRGGQEPQRPFEAVTKRLILTSLMFAVSSSRHKSAYSRASGSEWPRLSRAGGTIIKTTVDHALMRGLDTTGARSAVDA